MAPTSLNNATRTAVNNIWNSMVQQFGHLNPDGVIAIDAIHFHGLSNDVKAGVLDELAKYLNKPVSSILHAGTNALLYMGAKEIIESEKYAGVFPINLNFDREDFGKEMVHVPDNFLSMFVHDTPTDTAVSATTDTAVSATTDPILGQTGDYLTDEAVHSLTARVLARNYLDETPMERGVGGGGRAPRRPSNAFILYRKDKAPEIRDLYPNIHNNEISVMIGTLWHEESDEVRAAYNGAAELLKQRFNEIHPDYRYRPRRSHEIRRRATRNQNHTKYRYIRRQEEPEETIVSEWNLRPGQRIPEGRLPRYEIPIQLGPAVDASSAAYKLRRTIATPPSVFPSPIEEIIRSHFPGVSHVCQDSMGVHLVQNLPHIKKPMVSTIRPENLDAFIAMAEQRKLNNAVQQSLLPEQISFQDTAALMPPGPEDNVQVYEFLNFTTSEDNDGTGARSFGTSDSIFTTERIFSPLA